MKLVLANKLLHHILLRNLFEVTLNKIQSKLVKYFNS